MRKPARREWVHVGAVSTLGLEGSSLSLKGSSLRSTWR